MDGFQHENSQQKISVIVAMDDFIAAILVSTEKFTVLFSKILAA